MYIEVYEADIGERPQKIFFGGYRVLKKFPLTNIY
jgi:hypothetical protein